MDVSHSEDKTAWLKSKSRCDIHHVAGVLSAGAGVLWQRQQSSVYCSAGLVGEIYWQTRNLWP